MKNGPFIILAYEKSKLGYFGPLLLGIFIFSLGYGIFAYYGALDYFFSTYWIWVMAIGNAWVSSAFVFGFRRLNNFLMSAKNAFEISEESYSKLENNIKNGLFSDKKYFFYAIIPIGILVTIYLSTPIIFATDTEYTENTFFKNTGTLAYLYFLGWIGSFHFGFGSVIVVRFVIYIWKITRFNVRLRPYDFQSSESLKYLTQLTIYSSLYWFGGIVLALIILIPTVTSIFAIPFLVSAILFQILFFSVPINLIHKNMVLNKKNRQLEISNRLQEISNNDVKEQDLEFLTLATKYESIEKMKEWPVNIQIIGQEISGITVTILAGLLLANYI